MHSWWVYFSKKIKRIDLSPHRFSPRLLLSDITSHKNLQKNKQLKRHSAAQFAERATRAGIRICPDCSGLDLIPAVALGLAVALTVTLVSPCHLIRPFMPRVPLCSCFLTRGRAAYFVLPRVPWICLTSLIVRPCCSPVLNPVL